MAPKPPPMPSSWLAETTAEVNPKPATGRGRVKRPAAAVQVQTKRSKKDPPVTDPPAAAAAADGKDPPVKDPAVLPVTDPPTQVPPGAPEDTSSSTAALPPTSSRRAGRPRKVPAASAEAPGPAAEAAMVDADADGQLPEDMSTAEKRAKKAAFQRNIQEPGPRDKSFEAGNQRKCPSDIAADARVNPDKYFRDWCRKGGEWGEVVIEIKCRIETERETNDGMQ